MKRMESFQTAFVWYCVTLLMTWTAFALYCLNA